MLAVERQRGGEEGAALQKVTAVHGGTIIDSTANLAVHNATDVRCLKEIPAQGSSASLNRAPVNCLELEAYPHPYLGREGNADGGAGAEEMAQGSGGIEVLLLADDGDTAIGAANLGGVGEIVDRIGQGGDVGDVVVARIGAVEEVEELDEGKDGPALADLEGPRDLEVHLHVRRAAELIERGHDAIDDRAILAGVAGTVAIYGRGEAEWTGAFNLHP